VTLNRSDQAPPAHAAGAANLPAMRRRGVLARVAALCASVAVVVLAGGCGGASKVSGTQTLATFHTPSGQGINYLQPPMRLATQPLPGSTLNLVGSLYTQTNQSSRPYFQVAVQEGESPSGSVSIPLGEGGRAVTMRVERSCAAGKPYAFAFGWLRSSADRVLATNEHGDTKPFHQVIVPGRLRAGGSLVYRLLDNTATTILTTTSSGRVVAREPYGTGVKARCQ
jgi:hypothetical protein